METKYSVIQQDKMALSVQKGKLTLLCPFVSVLFADPNGPSPLWVWFVYVFVIFLELIFLEQWVTRPRCMPKDREKAAKTI